MENQHRLNNRKLEFGIIATTFVAYVFCCAYIIYLSASSYVINTILASVLIFIFIVRSMIVVKNKNQFIWITYFLLLIELFIIYYLFYLGNYTVIEFMLLIFVANIVICFPVKVSLIYAFSGYAIYYYLNILKNGLAVSEIPISDLIINITNYAFLVSVMVIAKNQIKQNEKNKALMCELEQLAVLEERNRIAGEMHDTVGHTITTAIVELEACKLLFNDDPEKAYKKLSLASEQVKSSLHQMRSTIKKIKNDDLLQGFFQSVRALAEKTRKHTGVNVVVEIDEKLSTKPLHKKIIYSTIQEAITNSVKHGKSSEILITLSQAKEYITLTIIDNGIGASVIEFGFGLTTMRNRVVGIGGELKVDSCVEKGFNITVKIPM